MGVRAQRLRDVFAFTALFLLWDGDGLRDLLSWWGFSALSLLLLLGGVVIMVQERRHLKRLLRRTTTLPLLIFVGLSLLSTTWSAYPSSTLLCFTVQLSTTIVAVALVLAQPIGRLVGIFALMVHVNLVLSLVFEAVVPFLPSHELMPFFTDYSAGAPGAFFWSQGLLFTGQRIQGIVGNANLTCFLALLGMITVGCLLAARRIDRRLGAAALVLDLLLFGLTRSATVLIAAGTVVAATLLMLGYRHIRGHGRILLTIGALAIATLATLSSSAVFDPVTRLLGKADDLTGRLEIWHIVGTYVAQRPLFGWGFVGWWVPWSPPFQNLIVRAGVTYLQAHNAFFDVELQLGVVGLAAFALLVGSVAFRALRLAAVRAPLTLLPLLLLAALLTQALAESRLLIEGNWAMLAMLCVALPWGRHHRLPPELGTSRTADALVTIGGTPRGASRSTPSAPTDRSA